MLRVFHTAISNTNSSSTLNAFLSKPSTLQMKTNKHTCKTHSKLGRTSIISQRILDELKRVTGTHYVHVGCCCSV